MSVLPQDGWESYPYQTENGLVVASFHTGADKVEKGQYPYCARVQIAIKEPNSNGGPRQEEAEVLWTMEDRLVESLDAAETPCLLVGRLTHGGRRELVFQVADYGPFRPPVGRWMQTHRDYDTDVSEHDGWDFFFQSVWPSYTSWLMILDRRVIDKLVQAGSDPAKPHSLEFAFRGKVDQLAILQRKLESRNYTLLALSPEDSQLVMAVSMRLELQSIFRESLAHRDECAKLGLDYDGWGASVQT